MQNPDERHERCVETGLYQPVTYLLIDDLYIARTEGVHRVLNKPERLSEPVLQRDQPWEVGTHMWFINGALYDAQERLYKLWYLAHDPGFREEQPELLWEHRYAYAVSQDCRDWEKPRLGLVDWNGSKDNNLVALPYPTGGDGPLANVVKDLHDPDPKRRYKALGMERHARQPGERAVTWSSDPTVGNQPNAPQENPLVAGLWIYDSADGVVWTRRPRKQLSCALVMDGVFLHGFDEDLGAWLVWPRARYEPKYRTVGVSITRDLDQIPFPQMAMAPDEDDPPGVDFDRLMTIKVPGGYVGLLRVMISKGKERRPIECQLAFSRDARVWSRPAGRAPFLSCGPEGSFDDRSICPANPLQAGDDLSILYSANTVVQGGARIGLCTLKRDRWAAIESIGSIAGVLQTRPVYFANNTLAVNADARRGCLRAELCDIRSNRPIAGFSRDECDPFDGDSLTHTMSWNRRKQIPEEVIGAGYVEGLPGRVISVRFYLDGVRLYSFTC